MGNNSAGKTGGGNDGQIDKGRGSVMKFSFTKSGRKTGKVGGGGRDSSNKLSEDGNKRVVKDSRLT